MPLPVLPSKLVWERVRVEFNFSADLEYNETITSWVVNSTVQSGEDASPENLIATRRFLDGPRAFQWIIAGVPGVIYTLTGTAISSLGKTYKLERTLAIVPCEEVIPPLFGVVYTTTPYPVEITEDISIGFTHVNGYTTTPPLDQTDLVFQIVSGSLREPLLVYTVPLEQVDLAFVYTGGDLRAPLVQYSIPLEQTDITFVYTSGLLDEILIQYTNWPLEQMDISFRLTGGSLT